MKKWTGIYWQQSTLCSVGLTVQFGHNGGHCALPQQYGHLLTVLHINGFHQLRVNYCQCSGPPGGHYPGTQLLRSSLFPATVAQPRTAFTFDVLELFHHQTLQGKTTAWDFYNALAHFTDNTGLHTPSVSACYHSNCDI